MRAIDLFAGWGGFTAGAEQAGLRVVWAANHWALAVEAHRLNHPHVQHVCQDLRQADWTQLPEYEVLLASPACQGHSTASQPKRRLYHDAERATAWAVVDCADVTMPRTIVVENVLAFRRWRLYPVWREALQRLGYHLDELTLTASDYGVPQRRQRLFVVGRRRGERRPITLTTQAEEGFGPALEPDAGGWRAIDNARGENAQYRMRRASRKFGRCLVQHVTGHPGVPLDQPIRTLTTKDQWVLVDGDRYRPLTLREIARGMGFADSFQWPETSRTLCIKGLGNAVCPPVAETLLRRLAA